MPIYDYRCNECGTVYDVFHKVREVIEDVVCPSCRSTNATRLLSAPNVAIAGASTISSSDSSDVSCASGSCCGGACGLD
ncbi:MAG TPA: zinc ribbon domain-containing protein [Bacteroidota bacterium]|nr:zinc ribbon domain-containing protein [Bacteroidota bacterium]